MQGITDCQASGKERAKENVPRNNSAKWLFPLKIWPWMLRNIDWWLPNDPSWTLAWSCPGNGRPCLYSGRTNHHCLVQCWFMVVIPRFSAKTGQDCRNRHVWTGLQRHQAGLLDELQFAESGNQEADRWGNRTHLYQGQVRWDVALQERLCREHNEAGNRHQQSAQTQLSGQNHPWHNGHRHSFWKQLAAAGTVYEWRRQCHFEKDCKSQADVKVWLHAEYICPGLADKRTLS